MEWLIEQTIDLRRPGLFVDPPVQYMMVSGDHIAHVWRVAVLEGGSPKVLEGGSVMGYFLRSDGVTAVSPGYVVGNICQVNLLAACYQVPGLVAGIVRYTSPQGQIVTLSRIRAQVVQGATDQLLDPGGMVPSLDVLMGKIALMEAAGAKAEAAALRADGASSLAAAAAGKLEGMTASATMQGTVSAVVRETGGHYHLELGIPKGKDGVIGTMTHGQWAMEIDAQGDLLVHYADGGSPPPLSINEAGDLIYTI